MYLYKFISRVDQKYCCTWFGRGETTLSWGKTTLSWGETTQSLGEADLGRNDRNSCLHVVHSFQECCNDNLLDSDKSV